jgi:hypothetical protein
MPTTNPARTLRPALLAAALFGSLGCRGGDGPQPVSRRHVEASADNLRQIGRAFHNYAAANGDEWASDITDKDGKPLLSWRVRLLPYLEQQALYQQFKLDEPWDGPNNKKLIEHRPAVYTPVRVPVQPGETFYQVFTGEGTLFHPNRRARFPASIPDGTSNTGLVFEAAEPVVWTKPRDLPFDEKKPLPKLGGEFEGQTLVLLCDGSVRRLRADPDEKELKKFIMPADGWVIDLGKIDAEK